MHSQTGEREREREREKERQVAGWNSKEETLKEFESPGKNLTEGEGITQSAPLLMDSVVYHSHILSQLPLARKRGRRSQQESWRYLCWGSGDIVRCLCV